MAYVPGNIITVTEFNTFANKVNELYCDLHPNVSSDYGYGKTNFLPVVKVADKINASDWNSLVSKIKEIATHQGSSIGEIPTTIEDINQIISKGDIVTVYSNLSAAITTIETNRLNVSSYYAVVKTASSQVRTNYWVGTLTEDVNVVFSSYNNMRYFFNSGGKLTFKPTIVVPSSASGTPNYNANSLFALIDKVDFTAHHTTCGYGTPLTNTGFYELNNSAWKTIYSGTIGSTGTNNLVEYIINAKLNGPVGSANTLLISITINSSNDVTSTSLQNSIIETKSNNPFFVISPSYNEITNISDTSYYQPTVDLSSLPNTIDERKYENLFSVTIADTQGIDYSNVTNNEPEYLVLNGTVVSNKYIDYDLTNEVLECKLDTNIVRIYRLKSDRSNSTRTLEIITGDESSTTDLTIEYSVKTSSGNLISDKKTIKINEKYPDWKKAARVDLYSSVENAVSLGNSVYISGDGRYAFVGDTNKKNNVDITTGSVTVFSKNSTGHWVSTGVELFGSLSDLNANYGSSVASSNDGNWLIVGANSELLSGDSGPLTGAAYIYEKVSESYISDVLTPVYTLHTRLTGSVLNSGFGSDVSIDESGISIAVASPTCDLYNNVNVVTHIQNGLVSFYERITNNWTLIQTQTGVTANIPKQSNKLFGKSVELNGTYCVVGMPGYNDVGGAIVYKKVYSDLTSSFSWDYSNYISSTGISFGDSTSISTEENIIVIGDSSVDSDNGLGRVYVYQIIEDKIANTEEIIFKTELSRLPNLQYSNFGHDVSVGHDGRTIAVASPNAVTTTNQFYETFVSSGTITNESSLILTPNTSLIGAATLINHDSLFDMHTIKGHTVIGFQSIQKSNGTQYVALYLEGVLPKEFISGISLQFSPLIDNLPTVQSVNYLELNAIDYHTSHYTDSGITMKNGKVVKSFTVWYFTNNTYSITVNFNKLFSANTDCVAKFTYDGSVIRESNGAVEDFDSVELYYEMQLRTNPTNANQFYGYDKLLSLGSIVNSNRSTFSKDGVSNYLNIEKIGTTYISASNSTLISIDFGSSNDLVLDGKPLSNKRIIIEGNVEYGNVGVQLSKIVLDPTKAEFSTPNPNEMVWDPGSIISLLPSETYLVYIVNCDTAYEELGSEIIAGSDFGNSLGSFNVTGYKKLDTTYKNNVGFINGNYKGCVIDSVNMKNATSTSAITQYKTNTVLSGLSTNLSGKGYSKQGINDIVSFINMDAKYSINNTSHSDPLSTMVPNQVTVNSKNYEIIKFGSFLNSDAVDTQTFIVELDNVVEYNSSEDEMVADFFEKITIEGVFKFRGLSEKGTVHVTRTELYFVPTDYPTIIRDLRSNASTNNYSVDIHQNQYLRMAHVVSQEHLDVAGGYFFLPAQDYNISFYTSNVVDINQKYTVDPIKNVFDFTIVSPYGRITDNNIVVGGEFKGLNSNTVYTNIMFNKNDSRLISKTYDSSIDGKTFNTSSIKNGPIKILKGSSYNESLLMTEGRKYKIRLVDTYYNNYPEDTLVSSGRVDIYQSHMLDNWAYSKDITNNYLLGNGYANSVCLSKGNNDLAIGFSGHILNDNSIGAIDLWGFIETAFSEPSISFTSGSYTVAENNIYSFNSTKVSGSLLPGAPDVVFSEQTIIIDGSSLYASADQTQINIMSLDEKGYTFKLKTGYLSVYKDTSLKTYTWKFVPTSFYSSIANTSNTFSFTYRTRNLNGFTKQTSLLLTITDGQVTTVALDLQDFTYTENAYGCLSANVGSDWDLGLSSQKINVDGVSVNVSDSVTPSLVDSKNMGVTVAGDKLLISDTLYDGIAEDAPLAMLMSDIPAGSKKIVGGTGSKFQTGHDLLLLYSTLHNVVTSTVGRSSIVLIVNGWDSPYVKTLSIAGKFQNWPQNEISPITNSFTNRSLNLLGDNAYITYLNGLENGNLYPNQKTVRYEWIFESRNYMFASGNTYYPKLLTVDTSNFVPGIYTHKNNVIGNAVNRTYVGDVLGFANSNITYCIDATHKKAIVPTKRLYLEDQELYVDYGLLFYMGNQTSTDTRLSSGICYKLVINNTSGAIVNENTISQILISGSFLTAPKNAINIADATAESIQTYRKLVLNVGEQVKISDGDDTLFGQNNYSYVTDGLNKHEWSWSSAVDSLTSKNFILDSDSVYNLRILTDAKIKIKARTYEILNKNSSNTICVGNFSPFIRGDIYKADSTYTVSKIDGMLYNIYTYQKYNGLQKSTKLAFEVQGTLPKDYFNSLTISGLFSESATQKIIVSFTNATFGTITNDADKKLSTRYYSKWEWDLSFPTTSSTDLDIGMFIEGEKYTFLPDVNIAPSSFIDAGIKGIKYNVYSSTSADVLVSANTYPNISTLDKKFVTLSDLYANTYSLAPNSIDSFNSLANKLITTDSSPLTTVFTMGNTTYQTNYIDCTSVYGDFSILNDLTIPLTSDDVTLTNLARTVVTGRLTLYVTANTNSYNMSTISGQSGGGTVKDTAYKGSNRTGWAEFVSNDGTIRRTYGLLTGTDIDTIPFMFKLDNKAVGSTVPNNRIYTWDTSFVYAENGTKKYLPFSKPWVDTKTYTQVVDRDLRYNNNYKSMMPIEKPYRRIVYTCLNRLSDKAINITYTTNDNSVTESTIFLDANSGILGTDYDYRYYSFDSSPI